MALGGGDPATQMRLEYRGADAAANPYLALGAIIRAGLDGIARGLPAPPMLDRDPALLTDEAAERFGVGALPRSLAEALAALDDDDIVRGWLRADAATTAYMSVKRAERRDGAARDTHDAGEARAERYGAIY